MRNVSRAIFLTVIFSLSVGCGVKTKIEDLPGPKKVVTPNSNPNSIKISNSAAELQGANVSLDYSIGFKDRVMAGTNVEATISISTNRPQ